MNAWNTPVESDYNRGVFNEELNDFLPERIFDAHVHLAPPDGFLPGVPFDCGGVPLTSYTYETLTADLALAFPGRVLCQRHEQLGARAHPPRGGGAG